MPSKQSQRRQAAKDKQREDLAFRHFSVRAQTLNAEERSVETVISTETPVMMYDYERWERVPEVLRADGAILPGQVPMLDNHARWSTEDQIGSARTLSRENNQIVGRLHFAGDATRQWELVRDGHLTDVSAGYQVLERTYVPKNTTTTVGGRQYEGPVNVVTKWKLREVSLTPIGADEQAKLRGFDPSAFPEEKDFSMNPELRSLLESRGMPKDLSDEDAQRWAVTNNFGEKKKEDEGKNQVTITDELRKLITESQTEAVKKALEEQQKRQEELRSIGDTCIRLAGVTRTPALDAKLSACRSREDIEKAILDYREDQEKSFGTRAHVVAGPAQVEKFEKGMRTALISRALDSVATPSAEHEHDNVGKRREAARERIFPAAEQDKDHSPHFRSASLFDLAREYVEKVNGVRTFEMTREEVAHFALLGPQRACEILGIRDAGAYHTTGSFSNLTLDAINKSMAMGYTEAPSTWEQVMRTGSDFTDFKAKNVFLMGAIPNLPVWNDNKDPEKASFADAKEAYTAECRSVEVDFSYRLLINDDMSALSRVPAMLGNSARRTVNAVAWSVITSNPTMRDGQALFSTVTGNRKKLNLTTGAGAPSTTTLQTLTNLMMQMTGENTPEQGTGPDILNLIPRYIIGPTALRTTILQLVMSVYDNASTGSLAYNMASQLIPVIEPLLDAASTTAWYLAADTSQIDTVEVSFLQGQRTPVTRQFIDPRKLSQSYIILHTFGAKALNWRGLQKHAGA